MKKLKRIFFSKKPEKHRKKRVFLKSNFFWDKNGKVIIPEKPNPNHKNKLLVAGLKTGKFFKILNLLEVKQ